MSNRTANGNYGSAFPRSEGRERVRELRDRGFTPDEMAKVLGVTKQAVHYHLKKLAAEKA
jgi:hypothetical protein